MIKKYLELRKNVIRHLELGDLVDSDLKLLALQYSVARYVANSLYGILFEPDEINMLETEKN